MTLLEGTRSETTRALASPPAGSRFLFYSHDGLGLGHTRRHLAVARALIELAPDSSVLLATGSDVVSRLGLTPGIDILKLPGLRKVANEEYASRRLGIPVLDIRNLRSALLRAAIQTYRPSVVLVDKHPLGAKGELAAGLEELRAQGGCSVLGLRDILDEPANVLKEWSIDGLRERIAELYDLVLVYGEWEVFDPVTEYHFPDDLAMRTRFCGYVVNCDEPDPSAESWSCPVTAAHGTGPSVLATAGGGEDGFFLLQTFLRAAVGAAWKGMAVAGPMSPSLKMLERMAARANVTLHTFFPNLSCLFRSVDVLVCMGGYNTLVEAISAGVPTVCVPRTFPRREQLIRARAFEQLGFISVIEPEKLTTRNLERAIQSTLGASRPARVRRAGSLLNFNGARRAAKHLLALSAARAAEPRMRFPGG